MGFKKKLCLVKEKTRTRNKYTLWCFVNSLLFSTLFHHSYPPLNVTKVVKCFLMFFGDFFFFFNIICLFVCFSLKRMNMSFAKQMYYQGTTFTNFQFLDIPLCHQIQQHARYGEFPFLGYPLVFPNLATYIIEVQN